MKNILSAILPIICLNAYAQLTPCYDPPSQSENAPIAIQKNFGDTITFEEYDSGTIITDQYISKGALFSAIPSNTYCDTYDYGIGSYGKILKNSTWYDQVKLTFVDPLDGTTIVPVNNFGYDNPIDSEIDYIVTNFYDQNDEIVFTYTSTSPELVSVELPAGIFASYVTFDDEQQTAYVVDDIWFVADTGKVSLLSEQVVHSSLVFPNPLTTSATIQLSTEVHNAQFQLFDTRARLVQQVNGISGHSMDVQRNGLPSGLYCYRILQEGTRVYYGNIRIE